MARFKIISKDGESVRYECKPKYVGTYLKPSYLEFSEIASPFPIEWEVGDYVDYPRTGMRYYLYSIPQASKNARREASGNSFTYSNVQFFARTKDLEIAPFRDLVIEDNYIHFSTSPDIATYEDVYGIARRIQVCMDDLYPGRWEIRVAEFDSLADAEIIERISTAKDFALSGGTCLDALSKIYELWQEMGWIHSHENGKEVITIGYANKLRADNATDAFLYGKGNGLTAIKKHQTNKDEFATRLYVYGSERNLPSRYYNGKEILNAESVDIRNLMIPMESWGRTDGLPDARKAYIENEEAVAKYGIIPRTHYFDSDEAGADIFPSIERMTIGNVRSALDTLGEDMYSPNISIYDDPAERIDEIVDAQNPSDDGVLNTNGRSWDEIAYFSYGEELVSTTVKKGETQATLGSFILAEKQSDIIKGKVTFKTYEPITGFVMDWGNISKATLVMEITDSLTKNKTFSEMSEREIAEPENGVRNFELPRVYSAKFSHESIESLYVVMHIKVEFKTAASEDFLCDYYINPGSSSLEVKKELPAEFHMTLKQIGFDISERAAQGEKKCISMKSGACDGRTFNILGCTYDAENDTWDLQCARQQDDTLGMLFPNADYPLSGGDRFVLLNISMPEIYVLSNSEKLLEEGMKLLERASRYQCNYEPQIDAKVMAESGRVLLEGMYMDIRDEDVVDSQAEHIPIDTLSIYEDESAIPTYKVTLREKRKVSYKGTPSATSPNSTKSAENISAEEIDLSDYATKSYVIQAVASGAAMSEWFEFDAEANMIRAKYGLYSVDEMAAGGIGEAIAIEGGGLDVEELQNYLDENKYVKEEYVNGKVSDAKEDIKDNPGYYVPLKTVNGMSLYGSGNIKVEGGSGSEGLTAINVNDKSFQPDDNGIVTLPDYPTVPPALKNPYALTFGNKTYNGSATKTIVESDIVTDIATIRANATLGAKALQRVPSEYITETKLNQKGYATTAALTQGLGGKVDKVSGMGLSTHDYTTAEKNKLSSLENYDDSAVTSSISTLQGYFIGGKAKDADKLDGHDSSYFATAESISSLSEIESWYYAVGSKFSKDADGIIKIEGDFYATGENSAGGKGEAVGGGGGGIDTDELDDILDQKGYATETWVNQQGFAKGTIPTKVSQLTNDASYITDNTLDTALSGKVDKENGKGLSTYDYTKADKDKLASLENYDDSGIKGSIEALESNFSNGKAKDADKLDGKDSSYFATSASVSTLQGYFTNGKANKAIADENGVNISSNYAKQSWVTSLGYLKATEAAEIYATKETVGGINQRLSALEAWYDKVGIKISYDEVSKAVKVVGDFYSTGENSAGGAGEEILNFEEVLSRLSALENAAAGIPKNIELGISKLSSYDGKEITSATMASLTGLSLDVAIKMTEGAYNKVIDRTGNYAQTWNYSACGTSTGMTVQFRQGDGFDVEKGYSLTYTISTAKWKIIMGEI